MLFKIIMYFISRNERLKSRVFHNLLSGRPIIEDATIEGTGMTFMGNVFNRVVIKNSELVEPLTVEGSNNTITANTLRNEVTGMVSGVQLA